MILSIDADIAFDQKASCLEIEIFIWKLEKYVDPRDVLDIILATTGEKVYWEKLLSYCWSYWEKQNQLLRGPGSVSQIFLSS